MPSTPNQPGDSENENTRFAHNPSAEAADKTLKPTSKKEGAGSREAGKPGDAKDLSAAENSPAKVGGKEDASSQEQKPWNTRLGNKDKDGKNSKSKGKMSKRKKRILMSVFMLVATSVFGIAAFFIFLPFKIVNLMENLKESASELAERPVEKRFTYLLTRYLAGKIVAGEDGNEFDRYVCPSGGIGCSVLKTWFLNRFEEKLGMTIESNRSGDGRATNWKITTADGTVIEGEGGDLDGIVEQLEREINGSRAMRTWLREEVKTKTKWHNVYQRYAMRKMLMRKYGVTGWRGPEKLENKFDTYADYKRAIELKLKTTFSLASMGRVVKKMAAYMGCLFDDDTGNCKNLQTDETPPPEKPPQQSENEKDKQALEAASQGKDAIEGAGGNINLEEVVEEAAASGGNSDEIAKQMRKIITKRILAAGVAGIGIIDVLASVVEKIDQGAVNAIAENKNEIAYAGYATELATIEDKLREGDLDPETAQAMGEIITNYEKSPLAQHEMGTAKDLGKPGHEVQRDCDEDGDLEKLEPGEFVCPNKKVTYDVTAFITSWPAWDSVIVPIATAWNNSIGAVFDFFNAVAGGIFDAVGFNRLIEWVLEITGLASLAEEVMESIFSTFIGSPITGAEEDGDAYDATSIGVKVMYNGMAKNGVDQEGNGMGIGGKALSEDEIAEINNAAARDKEEDFKSQSLMARLFDPSLTGSTVNTLIARTPSNLSSLLYTPLASLSRLAAPSAGAYPYTKENPGGLVIYGYAENSNVYNTPLGTYTEETCKQMAEARDASYERRDGEISPRYHEVDGCALERVVRISATAAFTDEHAQEFKLYQNDTGSSSAPAGAPGETIQKNKGWSLKDNTDYTGTLCPAGTAETQVYTHPKRGFKIRVCAIKRANGENSSIDLASIAAGQAVNMINTARGAGVDLIGTSSGFRSYEEQVAIRKKNCSGDPLSPGASCSPPTALPGNSEHERGLAIDFSAGGAIRRGSPQFNWLQANAATYGFFNLPSESWHWSTSGG